MCISGYLQTLPWAVQKRQEINTDALPKLVHNVRHMQACQARPNKVDGSAPLEGGPPGTAPSGMPAIPKTSTSIDSLPGLAKGTLRPH